MQVWVANSSALQASKQVQYTLMLVTWPSATACLVPGDLPLYKRHMGHLANNLASSTPAYIAAALSGAQQLDARTSPLLGRLGTPNTGCLCLLLCMTA